MEQNDKGSIYPFRLSDIIASSITHGIGLLLAIAGMIVLIVKAGSPKELAGSIVFGIALVLSYGSSTLYHSLTRTKAYRFLQVIDHSMIYILIAGSYSPVVLTMLTPTVGWTLFGIVWSIALIGIISKMIALGKYPKLSVSLYLAMGWLIAFFIVPLCRVLSVGEIILLVAGGISYTIGIVFFSLDKVKYFHPIWHLFVLAGSICHYFLILSYFIR